MTRSAVLAGRPRPGQPAAAPSWLHHGQGPSAAPAYTRLLLSRATFTGPTPEALAAVEAAGGAQAWLARQLAPVAALDAALDTQLAARWPLAHTPAPTVWATTDNGSWDAGLALAQWTLAKAAWSANQLQEVMVEFWSNHLNIPTPGGNAWATKGDNDTAVIRAHALGRYDDMLAASVLSPAMLESLTNVDNTKDAPDENLGREIMELHSVGVDAGYGQDGVVQASRALTGLSVWNPWNGGTAATNGTFRYSADDRYVGRVTVLGWSHPNSDVNGGAAVAVSFARYLANHPATATRIASKLAVRFVADTPPPALVARLAAVYTASRTAIVPVLQALFASPEFAASASQKMRRPVEDATATLAALGWQLDPTSTSTDGIENVYWDLWNRGAAPLSWPAPNGFPDVLQAWVGTGEALARWNSHLATAAGWFGDGLTRPTLASRVGAVQGASRTSLVTALLTRFGSGAAVPPAQVSALVGWLGGPGPLTGQDVGWKLPYLVALALDAPAWSAR